MEDYYTYQYYVLWTWILAIVPGSIFALLLLIIISPLLACLWNKLKPEPFTADVSSRNKSLRHRTVLQNVLDLTVRACHYFYGDDSTIILTRKDELPYGIKICGRKFKLTGWVYWSLVAYVITTISVIFSVVLNFFIIHESKICNTRYDCFLAIDDKNYNNTPIASCDDALDKEVKCFHFDYQVAVAVGLSGGFIKLVPPFVFNASTAFYLIVIRKLHIVIKVLCNLGLIFVFAGLLATISVFTGLRFIYDKSEEAAAQTIVFLILCFAFAFWPWYLYEWAHIPNEKPSNEDQEQIAVELCENN